MAFGVFGNVCMCIGAYRCKFNDRPHICPSTTRYYLGIMILLLPSTMTDNTLCLCLPFSACLSPCFSHTLIVTLDISGKISKSPNSSK